MLEESFAVTVLTLLAGGIAAQISKPADQVEPAVPGNERCASCHAEIYESYKKTAMARASGPASEGLVTGEVNDSNSSVGYRVYTQGGHVWMSYERDKEVRGKRELLCFIGSGVKGRTYLFSDEGYLFEAPINWYSQERRWNMTPAYIDAREIPINRRRIRAARTATPAGCNRAFLGYGTSLPERPFCITESPASGPMARATATWQRAREAL